MYFFVVEQDIEQRCANDMDTNVQCHSVNIEPLFGFDGLEADDSYFTIEQNIGQMHTEEIDNNLERFCPNKIDVPLSTLDNKTEAGNFFVTNTFLMVCCLYRYRVSILKYYF